MGTFCKVYTGAGIGGTGDGFEALSTGSLGHKAQGVIGLIVAAGMLTQTTVEGNQSQLRVSIDDLDISKEVIPLRGGWGAGPSTNIQGSPGIYNVIPVNWAGEGAAGAEIEIEFASSLPDPTGTYDVVAGVMYADEQIDMAEFWRMYPLNRIDSSLRTGFDAEAVAAAVTTAETAITDLNLPSKAEKILGFNQQAVRDDIANAEKAYVGYVRYRSGLGLGDQEYPFAPYNGDLGTAVGPNIFLPPSMSPWIPVEIPIDLSKKETITPNVVLVAAPTDDYAVQSGICYGRRI